jgi:CDI immunity proteins
MPGETLERLEGDVWSSPEFDSSLVLTVHQLRKKPLADFTTEDLRIVIGQGVGLVHLIPIAISVLEKEPLAEGDFYPGDLLASVVRNRSWLEKHPNFAETVAAIARKALIGPVEADLSDLLTRYLGPPRS